MNDPLAVSWGMGVNSTAMLAGCKEKGVRPDVILAADTGGEKPETYAYLERFQAWLAAADFPPVIVVRNEGVDKSLEGACLKLGVLPSIAYGWKTCSQRFKMEPQMKWLKAWPQALQAWSEGRKVVRMVGFDAAESHRAASFTKDDKYRNWYPLIEWGWDRKDCIAAIQRAGLEVPPKSACFFCPSMKKHEVLDLAERHPDLFARAVKMEQEAAPGNTSVKGLGRSWSWEKLVAADREQRRLFTETVDTPCGCFDGEE